MTVACAGIKRTKRRWKWRSRGHVTYPRFGIKRVPDTMEDVFRRVGRYRLPLGQQKYAAHSPPRRVKATDNNVQTFSRLACGITN